MSALQWSAVELAIQSWLTTGSGLPSSNVIWAQQGRPRPSGTFISMRLDGITGSDWDWLASQTNVLTVGSLTISAVAGNALTIAGHGLVSGDGPLQPGGTLPAPLSSSTSCWAIVIDANTVQLAATFQNAIAATPVPITLTSSTTGGTLSGTPTTVRAGQEIKQFLRGPRQALLHLQCFAGVAGSPPAAGPGTGTSSPLAVLHDALTAHGLDAINDALVAAGIGVAGWEPVRSIDGVVNSTTFEPRAMTTVRLHLASEISGTVTEIQVVNTTDQIPTTPVSVVITLPS